MFSVIPLEVGDVYRFLSLAKQAGCKFTLATDSHSQEAQRRLPELKVITDAIGLTEDDIHPLLQKV